MKNLSAGGVNSTFTFPQSGDYKLCIYSVRGWGCGVLNLVSTTAKSYTIVDKYNAENSGVAYAYMILDVTVDKGDTITTLHGASDGYVPTVFYTLINR